MTTEQTSSINKHPWEMTGAEFTEGSLDDNNSIAVVQIDQGYGKEPRETLARLGVRVRMGHDSIGYRTKGLSSFPYDHTTPDSETHESRVRIASHEDVRRIAVEHGMTRPAAEQNN